MRDSLIDVFINCLQVKLFGWLLKVPALPAAAKGLDEVNRCDEPLPGKLCAAAFGLKRHAIRVHDFEIAHDAGAITLTRKFSGATRVCHRAILSGGLIGEKMNPGETALHVTKRHEDALAVVRDRFFKGGLRPLIVREISAAGKNRQRKTR